WVRRAITRPGARINHRWYGDAGAAVHGAAGDRALSGGAGVARVHLPPRSDQPQARRAVARRRPCRRPVGPDREPGGERVPVRDPLGVLELLGAFEVALHGADHGAPEDFRDAGAWLLRLSGIRARVLHDVCLRAADAVPEARLHDRVVICAAPAFNTAALISHALILTAGLGTRLRPLTEDRAKPAIPIGGEPLIRRIIAGLTAHGVVDLALNLHH